MKKSIVTLAALLGIPLAAMAHPGHEAVGFLGAFMHPLTGIDHLLVMLAVGFWAARAGSENRFIIPSLFLGALFAGLFVGTLMTASSLVEQSIALSVIAMAIVLVVASRIPFALQLIITSVFAVLHGLVHGQELITSGNSFIACAGLALSTSLILAVGYVLGSQKQKLCAFLQQVLVAILTVAGSVLVLS